MKMFIFCLALSCIVSAADRIIPMQFTGANDQYDAAGLYYGTLPKTDPASKRTEFMRLLKARGIHALRFPGGTPANTKFLVGHEEVMRSRFHCAGLPEGDPAKLVSLWNFLDFCREAGILPIYQVNTLLYCDGSKIFLLAKCASGWVKDEVVFDPGRRGDAAKALTELVEKVGKKGYHVQWELGNEEYAMISAADYSDIARREIMAIRKVDPKAMIWVTLGSNFCSAQDKKLIPPWSEALLKNLSGAGLAKDANLGFTLHYVWREYVDYYSELVARYGFKPRLAVTEFHLAGAGPYWELSPRYGYALGLAHFLIEMSSLPGIELLCFHNLTSQNFGMFHYNQRSYGPPGMETWDPSLGYQAMPAAYVYGLFNGVLGGTVVEAGSTPSQLVVKVGGERRIFLVNDSVNPRSYQLGRDVVGKRARTFEGQMLVPASAPEPTKGQPGPSAAALGQSSQDTDLLRMDQVKEQSLKGVMDENGLNIEIPSYGIVYLRCLK